MSPLLSANTSCLAVLANPPSATQIPNFERPNLRVTLSRSRAITSVPTGFFDQFLHSTRKKSPGERAGDRASGWRR